MQEDEKKDQIKADKMNYLLIASLGLLFLVLGIFIWRGFNKSSTETVADAVPTLEPFGVEQTNPGLNPTVMENVTELTIEDLVVGSGEEATAGRTVAVHYTGTFTNGAKFDSSLDRGAPFSFTLGAGEVIQGWDQGVAGMKVGGKRKLIIPPHLGYGEQPNGPIPGNSVLVFEVELLEVR